MKFKKLDGLLMASLQSVAAVIQTRTYGHSQSGTVYLLYIFPFSVRVYSPRSVRIFSLNRSSQQQRSAAPWFQLLCYYNGLVNIGFVLSRPVPQKQEGGMQSIYIYRWTVIFSTEQRKLVQHFFSFREYTQTSLYRMVKQTLQMQSVCLTDQLLVAACLAD